MLYVNLPCELVSLFVSCYLSYLHQSHVESCCIKIHRHHILGVLSLLSLCLLQGKSLSYCTDGKILSLLPSFAAVDQMKGRFFVSGCKVPKQFLTRNWLAIVCICNLAGIRRLFFPFKVQIRSSVVVYILRSVLILGKYVFSRLESHGFLPKIKLTKMSDLFLSMWHINCDSV